MQLHFLTLSFSVVSSPVFVAPYPYLTATYAMRYWIISDNILYFILSQCLWIFCRVFSCLCCSISVSNGCIYHEILNHFRQYPVLHFITVSLNYSSLILLPAEQLRFFSAVIHFTNYSLIVHPLCRWRHESCINQLQQHRLWDISCIN